MYIFIKHFVAFENLSMTSKSLLFLPKRLTTLENALQNDRVLLQPRRVSLICFHRLLLISIIIMFPFLFQNFVSLTVAFLSKTRLLCRE